MGDICRVSLAALFKYWATVLCNKLNWLRCVFEIDSVYLLSFVNIELMERLNFLYILEMIRKIGKEKSTNFHISWWNLKTVQHWVKNNIICHPPTYSAVNWHSPQLHWWKYILNYRYIKLYLGFTILMLPGKSWLLKILTQLSVSTEACLFG